MIAKITLENFFSFGGPTTVELNAGINMLVGINGSGKSNMLKAVKMLYEGVVGEGFEKIFLKNWSGFTAVANFNQTQEDYIRLTFEFDRNAIKKAVDNRGYRFSRNPVYEITIFRLGSTSYYLKEKIYAESIHEGQSAFIFMEMENAEGIISTREGGKTGIQRYPHEKKQISFKASELVLRQISDPDRFYPLFTLKRALEQFAVYDYFDTTAESAIRQPGSYTIEERLWPNGENLLSVLLRIKNHHALAYEKIEQYIKRINPHFKDINFDIIGSKLFLVLREQYLSRSVSIEHISDGTLHYLLLLAILLNPARGNLLCIDEPEISLHPDMIFTVAEVLKIASEDHSQLIVATHSPLLLNAFDLDEIYVFEKNQHNETEVHTKTESDFKQWQNEYLAGQLWLQGLIGGKRW
ncbi:MAG: chromosome segregation protein SMC [Bacteroidetes bacterium]|nr:MAG: chromosome segregation protein SMC [Bacteroidota bacterium]